MLTIIDYKLGKIAKLENTKTLLGNVFSVPDYNENSMTVYFANDGETLKELIKFIYNNIQYAEFNTKSDYCHVCGFDGEIIINDQNEWECPQCGNKDHNKMNVTRRTCGYLGENFWNVGKTKEIKSRVLHI